MGWTGSPGRSAALVWSRLGRVAVVAFCVWILVRCRMAGYLGNAEQVLPGKVLTVIRRLPTSTVV